jgi:hypothetical protein
MHDGALDLSVTYFDNIAAKANSSLILWWKADGGGVPVVGG